MLLNKQAIAMLGLCARARQLVSGETVVDAIRKQQAHLVLYANDACVNNSSNVCK